jgi:CubicO group peptidase (beta-lactamase class C family)
VKVTVTVSPTAAPDGATEAKKGPRRSTLIAASTSPWKEMPRPTGKFAGATDVFQRGGLGLFSTADDYLAFARMLLDGKAPDGSRILGRKTLELMHANHLAPALLPYKLAGVPVPGWGFGLGSRVALDIGQMGVAGTVGEFGWAGAAKTYYWVDPREELVAVLMTQFMVGFDLPENDFRALVYQAIDD